MADTQWVVQEKDRSRVVYPSRMANYTAEQKEFYKNWSAKCYDLNNSILFYTDSKEYDNAASWSACCLHGLWEDFMAWAPTDEQLATLVLHERPSLKCGALAWFALRGTCVDKEYPNFLGDHRDSRYPTYLEDARS